MEPVRARRIIKKKSGGHGHHGGAWKVAYADFVTAMMALFMVMWLLASTDAKGRKEISNYFRTGVLPEGSMAMNSAAQTTPSVIEESGMPPTERRQLQEAAKAETKAQIKEQLGKLAAVDGELAKLARSVTVEVTDRGVVIQAVDQDDGLLFDVSSADLKPALVRLLRGLAPLLSEIGQPIEIDGHTDARPFAKGAVKSNWDLSFQRADAARRILELGGVSRQQVAGVLARGPSQLYVKDNPFASQNRRLSLLIRSDGGPAADAAPTAPDNGADPDVPPDPELPARAPKGSTSGAKSGAADDHGHE